MEDHPAIQVRGLQNIAVRGLGPGSVLFDIRLVHLYNRKRLRPKSNFCF